MNIRTTTPFTVTAAIALLTVAGATSAVAKPDPGGPARPAAELSVDPLTCPVTELAGHLVRCDYLTGQ